jgi:hypothetical protein
MEKLRHGKMILLLCQSGRIHTRGQG